ncbi:Hypothetical_protein [Hexamita inflata]|uniref:Hypothetical_protein n=1 Tax=Hexamita inflata TaxID=28002 RepID=A0AA86Q3C9_9EUKA|nr:Hypothetical protein HINF_LOCUS38826 [Hexamita inflata]
MTQYSDYDSCDNNCYEGYCKYDLGTSGYYGYQCTPYEIVSDIFVWLLLIPAVFVLVSIIACCCHKKKQQERLQMQRAMAEANKNKKVNPTPQTQVNQNVTGVAPQGQLVTLPNGQVGIFIPLTQPQQTQVRQVQAQQQQQAPQFYQPQPIYQQQIYQQAPQQIFKVQEEQTISTLAPALQMPVMPNMQ